MITLGIMARRCRSGYEDGHKFLVSVNGKGLGEKISKVVFSFEPSNYKLTLAYAVTYPMEVHVDAFCSARCDGVVGDADGTGVVAKN